MIARDLFKNEVPEVVRTLAANATVEARAWMSVVVGALARGLAPEVAAPDDRVSQEAFRFCVALANSLGSGKYHLEEDPSWLPKQILEKIISESRRCMPEASGEVLLPIASKRAGIDALRLSCNKDFVEFVEKRLGAAPTDQMVLTYLYYRNEGQRCCIHVDDPRRAQMNCLIGLEHTGVALDNPSCFRIFNQDGTHVDVDIQPGTALVFDACSIVHGRTPLADGEAVSLLSISMMKPERLDRLNCPELDPVRLLESDSRTTLPPWGE